MDLGDVILGQQARRNSLSGQNAPQRVIAAVVVADVVAASDPIPCRSVLSGVGFEATAWNMNGVTLPNEGDSAYLVQADDGTFVCLAYGP